MLLTFLLYETVQYERLLSKYLSTKPVSTDGNWWPSSISKWKKGSVAEVASIFYSSMFSA